MQRLTALTVAAALAVTSFSAPAFARKYDHYDRGNSHDRGYHRGWDHRAYPARRWREVTVYEAPSYPVYATRDYSEIRCTNSYNPLGLLVGGALGGVAGSTIGKGSGRDVAIGAGALMGGLLGNNMVQQRCSEQVFQQVPVGRPVSWQAGPGEAYAVVPTRDYRTDGRYCREYQAYANVGGRRQETYGTACMQPDGSWEVIN